MKLMKYALLAAPLCLALAPLGDQVTFHPKDGSSLAKKFAIDVGMELDDFSMTVDGNDMGENAPDLTLGAKGEMAITDKYVTTSAGKPLELIRSFDDVSLAWEANEESGHADEVEKLESRKVVFKWNAEEKRYDIEYHESEGDADLLESLSEDMDLRALLPTSESVATGAKWDVDVGGLGSVLFPGTRFEKLEMTGEDEVDQLISSDLLPQLEKAGAELKTACEYKGVREVDGVRVGVIAVKLEGKPVIDLSSIIEKAIKMQAEGQGADVDVKINKAQLAATFDGKGELLWNLADGHVHSFNMKADLELAFEADIDVDAQGQQLPFEASATLSGKGEWTVEAK